MRLQDADAPVEVLVGLSAELELSPVEFPVSSWLCGALGPQTEDDMTTRLSPQKFILSPRVVIVHSHDFVRFLKARQEFRPFG